jgi:hypothetical protein
LSVAGKTSQRRPGIGGAWKSIAVSHAQVMVGSEESTEPKFVSMAG